MAQIKGPRYWYAWTAALGLAFLLAVYLFTFWGWRGGTAEPYIKPPDLSLIAASPIETVRTVTHPAPLEADAFTESTLQAVEPGWLLVEYDTSSGAYRQPVVNVTPAPDPVTGVVGEPQPVAQGPAKWDVPGPRLLYVSDPTGELYLAGDLGVDSPYRLLAWLPDNRTAILKQRGSGDGATLHSIDLITGDISPAFAGPDGASGGTWESPQVEVARTGNNLIVEYGSGERGLSLLNYDGSFFAAAVPTIEGGDYVQAPVAFSYLVRERVGTGDDAEWAIVGYEQSGGGSPPNFVRTYHERPPGEPDCYPGVWPADRQMIVRCNRPDGTTRLYTLATATNTYVDAPTIRWAPLDGVFEFDDRGTRIAVSRAVFDIFGEAVWVLPTEAPQTTDLTWAGDYVVMWGVDDPERAEGLSSPFVRVHESTTGDIAYFLEAYDGAAGFVTVVPAF